MLFWLFFIMFGAAVVAMVWAVLGAYSTVGDVVRRKRAAMLLLGFAVAMFTYFLLGFKVSYDLRADGVKVVFGRWYMYVGAMWLLAMSLVASMTYDLVDMAVAGFFTAGLFVSLMFGSWVPSSAGHDHKVQLIMQVVMAGVFWLLYVVWTLPLAWGRPLLSWFRPNSTPIGLERVQNKAWYMGAAVVMATIFAFYILLFAMAPEAWSEYPGSRSNKELISSALLLFVLDVATGLLSLLAYSYLAENGDLALRTPFTAFDADAPEAQTRLPATVQTQIASKLGAAVFAGQRGMLA